MVKFNHLHLHTEFSILDGAVKIDELMDEVKRLGMDAVAITDHGNLFGAVKFSIAAAEKGIKPIIGVELYVAPESMHKKEPHEGLPVAYHLTVLAESEEGYKNLVKLVSLAYLEGFYHKPRVDKELLARYSKGLIALSGCLHGEVPYWLLLGSEEKAKKAAQDYIEIFGKDNFYIELMDQGLREQKEVNPKLVELAGKLGVKVVATNDVHYLRKSDSELHDVLLCIQTKAKLAEEGRMRFPTDEFYLKSPQQMQELFGEIPEALRSTVEIAERVDFAIKPAEKPLLPEFKVPEGYTIDSYFEKITREGFEKRWESELKGKTPYPKEEYLRRLDYEISTIKNMGYAGYFLIVWDIVSAARRMGIPVGPGRGSAAGSLVAYSLGITQLDPLRYGLLFERFLNPERVSMPDIDIDFCGRRREEVIEYITRKYGRENVSQIITFGTMAARGAVRDVGRVLDVDRQTVDRLAKMIPPTASVSELLSDPQDNPLKEEYKKGGQEIRKLLDLATSVEGKIRQTSIHAAGVVIAPKPLMEILPIYRSSRDEITTQYEMNDLEVIGLLKMDILGLRNLTIIDDVLKMLKEKEGIELRMEDIPLDDEKTFRLFQEGNTDGVFQFESSGMKESLRKAKPTKLEDLIALNALYRPGPIQAGTIERFARRKHGQEEVTYDFPELEPILKETYGLMIYQEQVMLIASKLAGFTMGEADTLRKAMGKKKKELMEELGRKFIEQAVERGYPRDKIEKLFNDMKGFAEYAFNKSHSAAYALLAYWTAYLKANYPVYFMAALLSNAAEMGRTSDVIKYINEAKAMGIEVLSPDINESDKYFTVVEKNKLRFGLAAIKNVGENAIDEILQTRRRVGRFRSLFHFAREVNTRVVNKKVMEYLIKAGAMDSFGWKRAHLMEMLDAAIKYAHDYKKVAQEQAYSLFPVELNEKDYIPQGVFQLEEWDEELLIKHEKEALGFYISKHPLANIMEQIEKVADTKIAEIHEEKFSKDRVRVVGVFTDIKKTTTKDKQPMARVKIEDLTGAIEGVIFPDTFKRHQFLVVDDRPVVIEARVSYGDEKKELIIDELKDFTESLLERAKELRIKLKLWDLEQDKLEQLRKALVTCPEGDTELSFSLETPTKERYYFRSELIPKLRLTYQAVAQLEKLLGKEGYELVY